mmetsp:Transcript_8183/g.25674  ORF Transcript_8183/g.25674 Transcript_8183/m.25674 type:complete len:200 (-) Transcript_8183:9-608(-)
MIKFRGRHARVIIHELALHPRIHRRAKAMHAAIGHTRIRRVHAAARVDDHADRIQLRMRRSKNILVPVKEQARGIEVVLRVLRVPDFILQSRLGQLHGFFILFGRLDELGGRLCRCEEEEPCDAHRPHRRRRGGAPRPPRRRCCSSARGCPSTQGTISPGGVRSRATTRRPGHLVSTREARRLPLWARLGSLSVTRLLV